MRQNPSGALENEIVKILGAHGMCAHGGYHDPEGMHRQIYKRDCRGGESAFSFGIGYSVNKTLFVRAAVGISSKLMLGLLEKISPGIAEVLSTPYGLLGWGISDIGATQFDPAPERPGTEFRVSAPLLIDEISRLKWLVPRWLEDAESFLFARPLYDFYRYDLRIDKTAERWREMVAILKLVRGEQYVAYQLLLDLVAEAAGLRPGEGNEVERELYGLRKNKKELLFQQKLFSLIDVANGHGVFGQDSAFHELGGIIEISREKD